MRKMPPAKRLPKTGLSLHPSCQATPSSLAKLRHTVFQSIHSQLQLSLQPCQLLPLLLVVRRFLLQMDTVSLTQSRRLLPKDVPGTKSSPMRMATRLQVRRVCSPHQEFQRFSTTDPNPQSFVRLSRSPFPQSERRNNTRKMVSFAQPPDVLLNSVILT